MKSNEEGDIDAETARRRACIEALSAARDGRSIITYVTSTRPGLEAEMAADAIPIIHEHLRALDLRPDRDRVDLFLHTNGGDGIVPWRLMTLLREFAREVSLLVPHHCYSAGTLTALGADTVIMHPMGVLGPTDPTSLTDFNPVHPLIPSQQVGVDVEDVSAYVKLVKEDVGVTEADPLVKAFALLAERVHPLALGNVKRLTQQMEMLGMRMLALRNGAEPETKPEEIVRGLNSELFYHGHPINRVEARDQLGLTFVEDPTPEVEEAMWRLYCAYADDMRFNEEFSLYGEAAARPGGLPEPPKWTTPGEQPPPAVSRVKVDNIKYVFVESMRRSDRREVDWDITVSRHWDGEADARSLVTAARWKTELARPSEVKDEEEKAA